MNDQEVAKLRKDFEEFVKDTHRKVRQLEQQIDDLQKEVKSLKGMQHHAL